MYEKLEFFFGVFLELAFSPEIFWQFSGDFPEVGEKCRPELASAFGDFLEMGFGLGRVLDLGLQIGDLLDFSWNFRRKPLVLTRGVTRLVR